MARYNAALRSVHAKTSADENKNKGQIFSKLSKIYTLTDEFSFCPVGCNLCEERENLLLLPYESEFIAKGCGTSGAIAFGKLRFGICWEQVNQPCPMLKRDGSCAVYSKRPFDCRSFPIVPRFPLKQPRVEFFMANVPYCPTKEAFSTPEFTITTIRCWLDIVQFLPDKWKKRYNYLNRHSYSKGKFLCARDLSKAPHDFSF
jgi:Fe-S-cluster containining protein